MFTVASIRREASPSGGAHAQSTPARAVSRAQVQLSVYVSGASARATC